MNSTISVTTNELQYMVENFVEQKLLELYGDPEAALELNDELKERLLRQRKELDEGVAKTYSFEEAMAKLGLNNV